MKKMYSKMWAIAMCLLAVGCSSEDNSIINEDNQVISFVATISDVSTRVAYDDVSDYMKVCWEVGDEVVLSNGVNDYTFHVTKVNDDRTAQLSYIGSIADAASFTGTATYAPSGNSTVQIANGNTEHLKYGEKMVATLSNVNLTSSPSVNFSHPETAVYKILYKVPENCEAGASIEMSGAWGNDVPSVSFDFPLVKNEVLTAYIIAKGGSISANSSLDFVFTLPKSANSLSTSVGGDEYHYSVNFSKDFTYSVGKYWIADIRSFPVEYRAIDLGVGDVKWATCNVNATVPEAVGKYYAYGDIVCSTFQQDRDLWADCTYRLKSTNTRDLCGRDDGNYCVLRYWEFGKSRLVLTESIVETDEDVATQLMGKLWKMPTKEQWQTVMNECVVTETTQNSEPCLKITGKDNKYIILPKAGYKYIIDHDLYLNRTYGSVDQVTRDLFDKSKVEPILESGCYYWTGETDIASSHFFNYYDFSNNIYMKAYYNAWCFAYNQDDNVMSTKVYNGMPVRGVTK